ncbi:Zinc finger, FYVE/PHD-type [Pseudocohnilembus persalinus]|uniref:1-phosphatidylinositol-3-phosphate 5-kinase n=1 Tax=Pseudocohnilembus persalinus TaxID=266149 RepID=A0A0V0R7F9_PSEPJ|nr:Zinc finger, FYVE/PHD-type [Pseudocohnilembus persalinus]|eukprot:KRX10436.1 Zinc finger, FYVE/PHD-type [Pseudocohnilembus persalinus]
MSRYQEIQPEKFLMPKEKWQPDEGSKNCFDCNASFNLFRRRHHCRKCGRIFCDSLIKEKNVNSFIFVRCSDNFIIGKYFNSDNKKIRFCKECYRQASEFIQDLLGIDIQESEDKIQSKSKFNDNNNKKNSENQNSFQNNQVSIASQQQNECRNNQNDFQKFQRSFEHDKEDNQLDFVSKKELEDMVMKKIRFLTDYLLGKNICSEKWKNYLFKFLQKSVQAIIIDSTKHSDKRDICDYVKVKKLLLKQDRKNFINYTQGIVCRNNVCNKKMRKNFENPKILIIASPIEYPAQDTNLENIIKNERKFIKKVVDQILSLNPDVVFVGASVCKLAIDQLFLNNVTLVYKIKPSILTKIAKATRSKIITELDRLGQIGNHKPLGTCRSLNFTQEQEISKHKDPTLMVLEAHNTYGGVSILIGGQSMEELKKVKRLIQEVLRLGRHLWLEKNMIYTNIQLLNSYRQLDKNRRIDEICSYGNFSMFTDEFLSLEEFIETKKMKYTRINFVRGQIENFNDIKSKEELENYIAQRGNNFNDSKVPYFVEICDTVNKDLNFTNHNQDISLAKYIIKKVDDLQNRCDICKRPKYNHVYIFYHGDTFVRIQAEDKYGLQNQQKWGVQGNQIQDKQKNVDLFKKKQSELETYFECEKCETVSSLNRLLGQGPSNASQSQSQNSNSKRASKVQSQQGAEQFSGQRISSKKESIISIVDESGHMQGKHNSHRFKIGDLEKSINQLGNGNLLLDDSGFDFQKYEFIPVFEKEPMSYISWAHNSAQYMQDVYLKENFNEYEYVFQKEQKMESLNGQGFSIQKSDFEDDQKLKEFLEQKLNMDYENKQEYNSLETYKIDIPLKKKIVFSAIKSQGQQKVNPELQILKQQIDDLDQEQQQNLSNSQFTPLQQKPLTLEKQISEEILTSNMNNVNMEKKLNSEQQLYLGNIQKKQGGQYEKIGNVTIYFPVQFEALRMCNNISLNRFIQSCLSSSGFETQGGKQNADFFKSADDLIITKVINQAEFKHFKKIALSYFHHMYIHRFESKPSLLAKIYGMLHVKIQNRDLYMVIMENLFFGIPAKEPYISVYDLKGSETNRFLKSVSSTLLDTNYKIDRNSEPLPVNKESYVIIDRALQRDCKFLASADVVDYSLLMIIDKKNMSLKMGLIDYLRDFDWASDIENKYKYLKTLGNVPTIVQPKKYKSRFLEEFLKRYIVEVNFKKDSLQTKKQGEKNMLCEKSLTEIIKQQDELIKQEIQNKNLISQNQESMEELAEKIQKINREQQEKILSQLREIEMKKRNEIEQEKRRYQEEQQQRLLHHKSKQESHHRENQILENNQQQQIIQDDIQMGKIQQNGQGNTDNQSKQKRQSEKSVEMVIDQNDDQQLINSRNNIEKDVIINNKNYKNDNINNDDNNGNNNNSQFNQNDLTNINNKSDKNDVQNNFDIKAQNGSIYDKNDKKQNDDTLQNLELNELDEQQQLEQFDLQMLKQKSLQELEDENEAEQEKIEKMKNASLMKQIDEEYDSSSISQKDYSDKGYNIENFQQQVEYDSIKQISENLRKQNLEENYGSNLALQAIQEEEINENIDELKQKV